MKSVLRFDTGGHVSCLHTEAIDLSLLGPLFVVRATDIVFNGDAQSWDVCHARTGEVLHSDPSRDKCLKWEWEHLQPRPSASSITQPTMIPCKTN